MADLGENLQRQFAERMIDGLDRNNVLRGNWAEQLVAHFLDAEPADQWSYFDLMWEKRTVSVKHSVGAAATFSVERSKSGWDWGSQEGWIDSEEPAYLCKLYVFAHLPLPKGEQPTLEQILAPELWRFAICTDAQMYEWFGERQKKATLGVLSTRAEFVRGVELGGLASALLSSCA